MVSAHSKTLTLAEEELSRKMPGSARTSPRIHAFRFIDLFAGIEATEGLRKPSVASAFLPGEWNKEAVRTYKVNWLNDV